MIGTKYQSTGVTVTPYGDKWSAEVSFHDEGFCNNDSTEGVVRTRYLIDGLSKAIDLVIKDAKRLGIQFVQTPAIYIGIPEMDIDKATADILGVECARLGWKNPYTR